MSKRSCSIVVLFLAKNILLLNKVKMEQKQYGDVLESF